MHILCLGGGPAGLYFSILMKLQDPATQVTVVERNRPFDTFGWGVVLSDQTLGNLQVADPVSAQLIGDSFNHWDYVEMFFNGRSARSGGHGFCGIGRKRLLNILQDRCLELGVQPVFETDVQDDQATAAAYSADMVIACDGLNSRLRSRYADTYNPDVELRNCRFVWLGTKKTFDAFTSAFEQTEHGWFADHAYQFDAATSTFIAETPETVWKAHGLDQMSQKGGIAFCEQLFAKYLDGQPLMNNATHVRGSAIWIRFPRVVCERWVHFETIGDKRIPIVLMGDAAHTPHFSIGSGTKLALEDAIELARCLAGQPDLYTALQTYEAVRSVEVLKIQNAARNSTEWFENVNRYSSLEAEQFFYSMMTRSQRISHENPRVRDAAWLKKYEQWLASSSAAPAQATSVPSGGILRQAQDEREEAGSAGVLSLHQQGPRDRLSRTAGAADPSGGSAPREAGSVGAISTPPMLLPLTVRELTLKNRIVVSSTAMYSAVDGIPQDFHLVHLGAGAKIGLQLGHSGPKDSTQLGWESPDEPLPNGNWPLLAASALAYGPSNQLPVAMTRSDMNQLTDKFVQSTRRAAKAGFDWLELHCAHGYLLSSFITPLTNQRNDDYGGTLVNRCRYPLEVFSAMREIWPAQLPMSVRISAHDWAPGGNTADDAVEIACLFKAAGCDVIDVSSGQTTRAAKPVYGRMYQTPFTDRIRNEVGIRTMAVGAISESDRSTASLRQVAPTCAPLPVRIWPIRPGRCMKRQNCKASRWTGRCPT